MTMKLFLRVSLDCYCIYFVFLGSRLTSLNAVQIELYHWQERTQPEGRTIEA